LLANPLRNEWLREMIKDIKSFIFLSANLNPRLAANTALVGHGWQHQHRPKLKGHGRNTVLAAGYPARPNFREEAL